MDFESSPYKDYSEVDMVCALGVLFMCYVARYFVHGLYTLYFHNSIGFVISYVCMFISTRVHLYSIWVCDFCFTSSRVFYFIASSGNIYPLSL